MKAYMQAHTHSRTYILTLYSIIHGYILNPVCRHCTRLSTSETGLDLLVHTIEVLERKMWRSYNGWSNGNGYLGNLTNYNVLSYCDIQHTWWVVRRWEIDWNNFRGGLLRGQGTFLIVWRETHNNIVNNNIVNTLTHTTHQLKHEDVIQSKCYDPSLQPQTASHVPDQVVK